VATGFPFGTYVYSGQLGPRKRGRGKGRGRPDHNHDHSSDHSSDHSETE